MSLQIVLVWNPICQPVWLFQPEMGDSLQIVPIWNLIWNNIDWDANHFFSTLIIECAKNLQLSPYKVVLVCQPAKLANSGQMGDLHMFGWS